MLIRPVSFLTLGLVLAGPSLGSASASDPIKDLQNSYIAGKSKKTARAYHFGSQGAGNTFSNHTSHSNRLIPVYVFGRKADLGAVIGRNSCYRDSEKIRKLYGALPENTVNPSAEYCDQSDLYRVQTEAVARGAKYMFTVWFDGMDWDTTRAAAIIKTGKVYTEGKGSGLVFQDYDAGGSAQFAYCVTSPTHDECTTDVDAQTVVIPKSSLLGGYDARVAGPNPWTVGDLWTPGYLKGQSGNTADKSGVLDAGRVMHAYTDSSQSAGEYATGVKSYNNGVNVTDDGRLVTPLFHQLQARRWKVGTATSVPFDHVSPAAMYAHDVHRDDFQDLAREMLGLPGICQQTGREVRHAGLDVVLGAGYGQESLDESMKGQGKNAAKGQNRYIADQDKQAIDVSNGGKYVVVQTAPNVNGGHSLAAAADRAAKGGHRLFGLFGTNESHLPYRTADGNFDPANGIKGIAEHYSASDREENPTLADMTVAAIAVLSSEKARPFALFVEAGDVDFGLHDNNLDTAVGAVYSGENAVKAIISWVEANSNWDESVLIVTADHGHYLVIDDAEALAAAGRR